MAQTPTAPTDPPAEFERILDISEIPLEGMERQVQMMQMQVQRMERQVQRLTYELGEAREEVVQKNRLLEIQRRTNDALDQQQITLRNRTQAQQDRIRNLQRQIRSRRQEAEKQTDISQIPAQLEKLKSSQSDMRYQLSSLQKELLVQRKNNEDLSSLVSKLNSQIEKLKNEHSLLQQKCANQETRQSRQFQSLGLQLQEERLKSQKLTNQVKRLSQRNEELSANLKRALDASQKPKEVAVPVKQVQLPSKVIQVKSKQSEVQIKMLETLVKQLRDKHRSQNFQKQKARKAYEKKIKDLKTQVNEETLQKENIRFKYIQLAGEFQRYKNGEFAVEENDIFPSSISQESKIPKKKFKDIDDEELDEDSVIKVNHVHKNMVKSLHTHLDSIPIQEKLSFLNIVTSWSEEQQQRLEISANDLNEG